MSPILDLQRRLREAGRIRIGQKVATRGGAKRPAKLDRFRFTSDRRSIEAVAALYGGEPVEWADSPTPGQWEVTTDATELGVLVPPSPLAFSQWYELWSGGGCRRRCDGVREVLTDGACQCDPSARECKPHTRLSVILTDLQGIGVWRLDSQGWNAATELAGVMDVAELAQQSGRMVNARLMLDNRTSKRVRPDGKTETFKYVVPALDLDMSARDLVPGQPGAELTPVEPARSAITPVPAKALPAPSVREQVATPPPAPRRTARSAPTLPSTGVQPRTAQDAAAPKWCQDLHIRARTLGIDDATLRAIVGAVTQNRTHSTRELTGTEAAEVNHRLTALADHNS